MCPTIGSIFTTSTTPFVGDFAASPNSCITQMTTQRNYFDAWAACRALNPDTAKFGTRLVWVKNAAMYNLTCSIQTVSRVCLRGSVSNVRLCAG